MNPDKSLIPKTSSKSDIAIDLTNPYLFFLSNDNEECYKDETDKQEEIRYV